MAAETIYTGFSSTKALLRAAMDVAIVGDAQPVPLIEREEFQQLDSVLAAIMLFGTPLPAPDAGRYVSEMTLAAELPGVPRDIIPTDVAALGRYVAAGRLQLRRTLAAA